MDDKLERRIADTLDAILAVMKANQAKGPQEVKFDPSRVHSGPFNKSTKPPEMMAGMSNQPASSKEAKPAGVA